jgi:membrane protein required for colicin V production
VTQFDLIAIALLLVSAVAGFLRGAAREVVTVAAFVLAAVASLFALRFSGPLGVKLIDPDWAGTVAAVLVVFTLVYLVLRLLGAGLAQRVQATHVLGALDRSIGFGVGLIRAAVVLGGFYLAFTAATPPERMPHWITGAATWPLTRTCGETLRTFVPKGMTMAGRLKPAFEDGGGDRDAGDGYDAPQRRKLDDLVEKSR